jgi:hypothetical protein
MDMADLETQSAATAAALAIEVVKLARVAYDITGRTPALQVYAAIQLLPTDNCGMVRMALHSLAVYLDLGVSSKDWLATCKQRARDGHTFRAVFHWQYKANRGLTPRITNRGGQLPGQPATSTERTTLDTEEQRTDGSNEPDSGDRLDKRDATKRRLRLSDLGR